MMTCIRDIVDEEQLEREFNSIRQVFKNLGKEDKPLRIEWGTRRAMEKGELDQHSFAKRAFVAEVLLAKASEFRSQNFEVGAKWIEELAKELLEILDMTPLPAIKVLPKKEE